MLPFAFQRLNIKVAGIELFLVVPDIETYATETPVKLSVAAPGGGAAQGWLLWNRCALNLECGLRNLGIANPHHSRVITGHDAVRALISADKAGIDWAFQQVAAIDLAGGDVDEQLKQRIVIESGEAHEMACPRFGGGASRSTVTSSWASSRPYATIRRSRIFCGQRSRQ